MPTFARDGRFHFPSQEAITSYLAKHPLTNNPYHHKHKINEAIATFFANSATVPLGIQMGVMLTIYTINQKLQLTEPALLSLNINLTQALRDCANGKAMQLGKQNCASRL